VGTCTNINANQVKFAPKNDECYLRSKNRPRPADYGLTQQSIDRVHARGELSEKRLLWGFAFSGVAFAFWGFMSQLHDGIIEALTTAFGSAIMGSAVVFMILSVVRNLLSRNPQTRRVEKHDQDLESFDYRRKRIVNEVKDRRRQLMRESEKALQSYWRDLEPKVLETAVAELYQRAGYQASVTPATGDRGVDVLLRKGTRELIVQCKAHSSPVGVGAVRELLGAMMDSHADQSILVSPQGFTSGARELAAKHRIDLVALEDLTAMARKYGVIAQTEQTSASPVDLLLSTVPDVVFHAACRFYSFSYSLLSDYRDCIHWSHLSENQAIAWTPQILDEFSPELNWHVLSSNSGVPWTAELLAEFADKWHWDVLSANPVLPWSLELLDRFKDRWIWRHPPREEKPGQITFDQRDHRYRGGTLTTNEGITWTDEMWHKYVDRLGWDPRMSNTEVDTFADLDEQDEGVFGQDDLDELVGACPHRWAEMSKREDLPWSAHLIRRYRSHWDWTALSMNESLPWTADLIEEFCHDWDYELLSGNERIPWSPSLIAKYNDGMNWEEPTDDGGIFVNFTCGWSWPALLANQGIIWTRELLWRYEDDIEEAEAWYCLADLANVDWNPRLLAEFGDRIGIAAALNPSVWNRALSSVIDDDAVRRMFNRFGDLYRDGENSH